ncbi:type II secretion system F family protein [Mycolicibacterium hippocampi]|uniref:type II secretion system F family protein n=1 Tax=Mycolicibacterium hippocampi TaxID=659824 RepID=UPI003517B16D
MTGAALALALAVMIAPVSAWRRARALTPTVSSRRRLPVVPFAVAGWAALLLLIPWTAVLAAGLLGATLLARRRVTRRRRVRTQEESALQAALDVLVGELRVGAHPVAAMSVAAGESHGRVARSLGSVAARAALGADVAAGLRAEALRSASPDHWERLAVCWELAQSHGLAIATLMQTAQRDITERARFVGRVEAGMAGARATAAILAGLPVLGVLLGQSIGAEPLPFLLSGGAGGWLLMIGSGLVCCGLLWSDRITASVSR